MESMKTIVLAAGKGTRLQCEQADLPKALRLLDGKPLIRYVLDNLDFLAPQDITIVVGFLKDKVIEQLGGGYHYVEQTELNGTAKATLCAEEILGNFPGPVLVCYCDMPFLRRETYLNMFRRHKETGSCNTVLAGRIHPIPPYGRLIRDGEGNLLDIVEDSACTPEQKLIDEVNIGIQVLDGKGMWGWLRQVRNDNPKREYYLTSLVGVLARQGLRQEVVLLEDEREMLGVNSMEDLLAAQRQLRALR